MNLFLRLIPAGTGMEYLQEVQARHEAEERELGSCAPTRSAIYAPRLVSFGLLAALCLAFPLPGQISPTSHLPVY